jgi:thioredoxin-related protein
VFDATKSKFSDVTFQSLDLDDPSNQSDVAKYGIKGIPHVVFLDASGNVLYNGGPARDLEGWAGQIQQYH